MLNKTNNDDTIVMNNTITNKIKDNAETLQKIDEQIADEPIISIESPRSQESDKTQQDNTMFQNNFRDNMQRQVSTK